jgi:hypothetical protein
VDPEHGDWFCHSQCAGGDVYQLEQKLHGGTFREARDRVFEIIGRPLPCLSREEKRAWAAQWKRDEEDEENAEYWHRGALLSLGWNLEFQKQRLFDAQGEPVAQVAEQVRRDTQREAELQLVSRSELLSLYRQQTAADPVMASLMIRLGKEDLDDIQSEAVTCVRMLEIQAARERRSAA